MLSFSKDLLSADGARLQAIRLALSVQQLRKSALEFSPAEQDVFKSAVTQAIASGLYNRIVWNHADMRHRQHSMSGPIGTLRFLPWHRDFVLKFEDAMRPFEPSFTVPYWDWVTQREIPAWIANFAPAGVRDLNGNPLTVQRSPKESDKLPTESNVADLFKKTKYEPFTSALEDVHNTVHDWVGGIMDDIMYSPTDPIFWLHHAQIDRIWWTWEASFPQQQPALIGADTVLDPWAETVQDLTRTKLRYVYSEPVQFADHT